MSAQQEPAQSSRQIVRWTISTCPTCGGLVERGLTTHLGECPRRYTAFVALEVEVVPLAKVVAALEADLISDGARINRIKEALGVA